MSAPTGTETTHTGHERDVDLSVFLTLKSAKIKGERRPPVSAAEIRVYGEKRWSLIGGIREITWVSRTQHIPQLHPLAFLAASALPRQRQERSTEEETPIARAVSGSLCVCARSLLITGICSEFRLLEARPFRLTETERVADINNDSYGAIPIREY